METVSHPWPCGSPWVCMFTGATAARMSCPRNAAWLAKTLPTNQKVAVKAADFALVKLLHMDKAYFESRIWPHMFYMGPADIWRWKMNVARAMGNSLDVAYVPDLIHAYHDIADERVRGMIAWALGRIGGSQSRRALKRLCRSGRWGCP